MKILIDNKQLFGIIALPRSGSSILAKFFNTPENSFCVSEPAHANINYETSAFNKIGKIDPRDDAEIPIQLREKLNNSEFDVGGIKEIQVSTQCHENKPKWDYLVDADLDFYVLNVREPRSCYSSWRRSFLHNYSIDCFVKTYRELFDIYYRMKERRIPVFCVEYHKFCNGPIEYVNSIFDGFLRVVGDLEQLHDLNVGFIDPVAIASKQIKKAETGFGNLRREEIERIDENLAVDYSKILNGC
jgi:hypothetical protein